MKRDADLIRKILLAVENSPSGNSLTSSKITGYDDETVGEHIELLIDANFIEAKVNKEYNKYIRIIIERLTWDGQEFLQAAKDDSIWALAKKKIIKETSSWTFSILLEYLKQEAKAKLGLA